MFQLDNYTTKKLVLKTFKPKTPSLRSRVIILKPKKEKFFLKDKVFGLKQKSGRSRGTISVRRRGGGHKRKFRLLSFNDKRSFYKVLSIEYDPNRSGLIAKVIFSDNCLGYVIAGSNLKVGDVSNNLSEDVSLGMVFKENTLLRLSQIPIGSHVFSLELKPQKKGQVCLAAGTFSRVIFKAGKYVQVTLPSGQRKWFLNTCRAIIGSVSQGSWNKTVLGKAGAARWLSKRPRVRGVAMNPKDHPHGGGTGKRSGGRPSVSPWGRLTKCGFRTSKKKFI
jgi:large subunit ribosomal protein L2